MLQSRISLDFPLHLKDRKIGHLSNGFIKKDQPAEPHTKNGRGDRAKMVKNEYYSSFTGRHYRRHVLELYFIKIVLGILEGVVLKMLLDRKVRDGIFAE